MLFTSFATLSFVEQWRKPEAETPWQIVFSDELQPPYPSGAQAIGRNLFSNNVRRIMGAAMDLADAYNDSGGGLGLTDADSVDYIQFLVAEGQAWSRGGLGRGVGGGIDGSRPEIGDSIVDKILDAGR